MSFDYWIQRQDRTVGACIMETREGLSTDPVFKTDGRRFYSTVNFTSLFGRQQEGRLDKNVKLKPLLFWIFFCLNDSTMVYKFDESHRPFAFNFEKDLVVVEIPSSLTHKLSEE